MNRRITFALIALLVALVVGDVLFSEHHKAKFFYQAIPGYKGLIGLAGCLLFIFMGKWIGKHWLQRKENEVRA
jgi:hypothetical protein